MIFQQLNFNDKGVIKRTNLPRIQNIFPKLPHISGTRRTFSDQIFHIISKAFPLNFVKAQRAQLCEISCFYQYAHHVIIDVASLLDEAALPEASSPYVVASLDEAASHNKAALIAEGVLLDASIPLLASLAEADSHEKASLRETGSLNETASLIMSQSHLKRQPHLMR